jgi:hypothetical protein
LSPSDAYERGCMRFDQRTGVRRLRGGHLVPVKRHRHRRDEFLSGQPLETLLDARVLLEGLEDHLQRAASHSAHHLSHPGRVTRPDRRAMRAETREPSGP